MLYSNNLFTPSADAIVTTVDDVETRSAPAFRATITQADELTFWQETFLDKGEIDDPVLSNTNNFYNYFRGLYFKAEANGDNGNMFLSLIHI